MTTNARHAHHRGDGSPSTRTILAGALLVLTAVLLQNAWLCDDAFFAIRPAWHLAHDLGLRNNVAERVQGFTSPLWTLCLAALMTLGADDYLGTILLSLALSLGSALAIWRIAGVRWSLGLLGIAALACSRALVDYAISGLEGPLAHALLAAFLLCWLRRSSEPRTPLWLGLLGAALALTRLDLVLVVAPALLVLFVAPPRPRDRLTLLAATLLPVLAWEAISLVYYGALVPNTALAKLDGAGLGRGLLLERGWSYLRDSAAWDPLLATLLVLAPLGMLRRPTRTVPLGVGMVLYLGYVVWIGGDYMAGRFLTAPAITAIVLILTALEPLPPAVGALLTTAVVSLGLAWEDGPVRTGLDFARRDPMAQRPSRFEVVDERLRSYAQTGLLPRVAAGHGVTHPPPLPAGPPRLVVTDIGFGAHGAGPSFHMVTTYGLTDPLVARMPPARPHQQRAGHVARVIPRGYLDSLRTAENRIQDPKVAPLLDDLWLVTRGPLLSRARWQAIFRLHDGRYDALRDATIEQEPPEVVLATQAQGHAPMPRQAPPP